MCKYRIPAVPMNCRNFLIAIKARFMKVRLFLLTLKMKNDKKQIGKSKPHFTMLGRSGPNLFLDFSQKRLIF